VKTRIVRRTAGWAMLSLIPLTFIGLATLTDQLAEMAVGIGIATFIFLAAYLGVRLLLSDGRQP
jgi:hypothetical protein